MKRNLIYIISLLLIYSCDNSKWETIEGLGINEEAKSINAIYFENESKGVIGGYELVRDFNAKNDFNLSEIPILYLTEDAGNNWEKIHFDTTIKQHVLNAYIHSDSLICETDSLILVSINKGITFQLFSDSVQRTIFINKYLNSNNSGIFNPFLQYDGIKYTVKEHYQNELALVAICMGPEVMTDYYFVSFDKGKTWTLLQKDIGDIEKKFLIKDKYLYRYYFPFGLQRLPLK